MALVVGELTAYLTVNKDGYNRGVREARGDLQNLARDAERQSDAVSTRSGRMVSTVSASMAQIGRNADKQGRDAGGKLAQGIHQGIIRNSPLIAAAVGGALAVGAPVAIAGATVLFGGIGAVAAAQSLAVRSAWTDLGHEIRDGAVADAAVLIPTYVGMADKVGDSFQRMRPQIRDAFEAAGPQIDSFTDSLTDTAENALPGLVQAVRNAGPVVEGLGNFLEDTGQGLGDFFSTLSDHSPAAGQALGSLGDITANLLPILAELLGQGAELAVDVLPAVADATGLTLDVLQLLGPALPPVVAGFIAFKVAKAASGYLDTFAGSAQKATVAMTGSATAGGRVGSVIGGVSRAMPLLAVATLGVSEAFAQAGKTEADFSGRLDDVYSRLRQGGAASEQARHELDVYREAADKFNGSFLGMGADIKGEFEKAREAARHYEESLNPVDAAQEQVAKSTSDLEDVVGHYGPASDEAAAASRRLARDQADLERKQADLELATHGVTSAMVAQAQQALASADSSIGYRLAVDDLEDRQAQLAETMKDPKATAEDLSDVMLKLEEDTLKAAAAAGQMASDALPAGTAELEKNAIATQGTLQELYRLRQEMGDNFPPALNDTIARLEVTASHLDIAGIEARALATNMRDLGLSVTEIPGQKFVQINAPTEQQKTAIEALGQSVYTLPDGNVIVYADTGPARLELARFIAVQAVKTIPLFGRIGGATGMKIPAGYSAGGKLSGPGGPTDDLIPGLTDNGNPIRVSPLEWVIQAMAGRKYGDRKMAAINAGTAIVTLPGERGLAGGGPVQDSGVAVMERTDRALFHADTVNLIEGTPEDVAQILAYKARTEGW